MQQAGHYKVLRFRIVCLSVNNDVRLKVTLQVNRNIQTGSICDIPFSGKKERKKERNGQRKTNQKGGENKERTTSTNLAPFEKFTVAHLVNTFVALCGT